MSRRGNGEGSIFKHGAVWRAVVSAAGGKRVWLSGATRREVNDKLGALLKARDDGLLLGSPRQTTAAYLQRWLVSAKTKVRASTWRGYEARVRVHLTPAIGRHSLALLSGAHLEALYAQLLADGSAPRTVGHVHATIRRALNVAVRWKMLARNVARDVDPPAVPKRDMKTMSEEQLRTFLAAAEGERLEAMYVVALTTGMRQGELLGLRWKSLDIEARSLQVTQTLQRTVDGWTFGPPKTAKSRRRIELSSPAAAALRRHRAAQRAERFKVGRAWRDQDLVFCDEVGGHLDPTMVTQQYYARVLVRAGISGIRFHDMRHTAATMLLLRGVHVKIVSEMLGHASIAITLDTYSHVLPTMQRDAAAAFEAILAGGAR